MTPHEREVMQQALDALEQITPDWRTSIDKHEQLNNSIEALRTALAQPENDFNPDWDAMAVMVEEQQRMAKRIEELEARLSQPEPAQCDGGQCGIGGYCKQCPKTKPDVPETAFGETKPVAWMYKGEPWFDGTIWHDQSEVTTHKRVAMFKDKNAKPLYTAPPQREWQGLTDEEIRNEANHHVFDESFFNGAVWARGKIKEKNNG